MLFEERILHSYAEPVSAQELVEGGVYFSVHYCEDMTIPSVETIVFIGWNLDDDESDCVYFQDAVSYYKGVQWDEEESILRCSQPDEHKDVLEYERALDGLLTCSLRRSGINRREMHWEARELNLDANPVSPEELQEESVYFEVRYLDKERFIPVMNTLVFVGIDLKIGDDSKYYFHDTSVYLHAAEGETDEPDEDCESLSSKCVSAHDLTNIFEFEKALEEWMRCSVRRRRHNAKT